MPTGVFTAHRGRRKKVKNLPPPAEDYTTSDSSDSSESQKKQIQRRLMRLVVIEVPSDEIKKGVLGENAN